MKKQKKQQQMPKLNPQQIIGYCQENFINIVPNICSNNNDHHKVQAQERHNEKQQLKIIMKQLSIFLQLTIQNCVLTSAPNIKSQSYRILGIFRDYLSRDLDDFENLIHHRNRTKLPFYQVDCKDFLGRQLIVKIPPQVSLYQDPLLFYNYSRVAQDQLFCNLPIYRTRQQRIQIIKKHIPFLDPNFIPVIQERLETKSKFNQVQDRLLLILLSLHEKKDISHFKHIYFPNRHQSQIRNRAKNLCAKQMINPIKTLKQNEYLPLTEQQCKIIIKAFMRFGPRWPVISKYYGIRSGQMLEAEYVNCPKLDKLRKSYNILINPVPLKEIIDRQISKQVVQHQQNERQSESMDIEQIEDRMQEQNQPIYKIINHLTFLYEQI